jgi:murein endopeptidase
VIRGLPTALAALTVTGLLAAAVAESPSSDASTAAPQPAPVEQLPPHTSTRPSRAVGKPWHGRLERGVQFPEAGDGFFTFDSALRKSPSRWWRRWATDLTVERTLAVIDDFHTAHPDGPRLGVGDLSLPHGGPFGREYGGLGHRSHQNGQDVDVYWPRADRAERPPHKPSQVDRALSQELVDRFVAAGAELVFVGPSLDLHGPHGVVQPLVHHDDHAHVRWPRR